MVYQEFSMSYIDVNGKKEKETKDYDQTRFLFYIRQDETIECLIIHRFKTMFSNCNRILSISTHRKKENMRLK